MDFASCNELKFAEGHDRSSAFRDQLDDEEKPKKDCAELPTDLSRRLEALEVVPRRKNRFQEHLSNKLTGEPHPNDRRSTQPNGTSSEKELNDRNQDQGCSVHQTSFDRSKCKSQPKNTRTGSQMDYVQNQEQACSELQVSFDGLIIKEKLKAPWLEHRLDKGKNIQGCSAYNKIPNRLTSKIQSKESGIESRLENNQKKQDQGYSGQKTKFDTLGKKRHPKDPWMVNRIYSDNKKQDLEYSRHQTDLDTLRKKRHPRDPGMVNQLNNDKKQIIGSLVYQTSSNLSGQSRPSHFKGPRATAQLGNDNNRSPLFFSQNSSNTFKGPSLINQKVKRPSLRSFLGNQLDSGEKQESGRLEHQTNLKQPIVQSQLFSTEQRKPKSLGTSNKLDKKQQGFSGYQPNNRTVRQPHHREKNQPGCANAGDCPPKNQVKNQNKGIFTCGRSKTGRIQRQPYKMSESQLCNLTKKDSSEILLIIINKGSGFILNIEQNNIERNVMAYVIISLGKAVMSQMQQVIHSMLNKTIVTAQSFCKNISVYLASFQTEKLAQGHHLDSLFYLSVLLQKFQVTFPSISTNPFMGIMPLFEKTCRLFLIKNSHYSETMKNIQEMDERKICSLKALRQLDIKEAFPKEKLTAPTTFENYRSIPILPRLEDIHQHKTVLHPNLVKGAYENAEHYLDVQYRLLREDYIRPFRDGIAEYSKLKKEKKPLKFCKDVKIYPNVYIIRQDYVSGGLVHIAYFDDKNFAKINWENSKHFLTGSLLCLSSDDFQTVLFAIVAVRNSKELKKGNVVLRFETLTDEVLTLSPFRCFTVVETTAYFEAYKHNLKALQDLDEKTFPMKSYIVEVHSDVQRPKYISDKTTYDMRPLLLPFNDKYIRFRKVYEGNWETVYEFPASVRHKVSRVNLANDADWPTCSDLNLDPFQFVAIKAALTKEFSIIQGPPGTGKTYVGLRIAQLLLHNACNTNMSSPILVICYTNHALDQFLEEMLTFTKNIVRVGGRGSNVALSQYKLINLKMESGGPNELSQSIGRKYGEMHDLKELILYKRKFIDKCWSIIFPDNVLRKIIEPKHYASLRQSNENTGRANDNGFVIRNWLGIKLLDKESDVEINIREPAFDAPFIKPLTSETNKNADEVMDDEDDIDLNCNEIGYEDDIEFIEAQRDIESDAFADVSFDVPTYDLFGVKEQDEDCGWQIQGAKKKHHGNIASGEKNNLLLKQKQLTQYEEYITLNLKNNDVMLEKDEEDIANIWELPMNRRWSLYKLWVERHVKDMGLDILESQRKFQKEFEELCEMRVEEDLRVCKKAQVVGMTTTGAAKYRELVQLLNPKIVIVEEAAELLESHIITSLARNTQHVILIGDHQQLKPNPTVYELAKEYKLDVSLFERMVKNGMECHKLSVQHRMRPEIASLLVPHIYENLQNHESVFNMENIKGISKNVFFVSHSYNELQQTNSTSKVNNHEANFIVKLCRYILLQGYEPSQITILTTYSGQLFAIKKLTAQGILNSVRCTVVDSYQGEENDIILISFVRSNDEGNIGFLKVSNRVCVALSRAKKGLFCIGNFQLLAKKSILWKNILTSLENIQAIGTSLQLVCQNHPTTKNMVAIGKDFISVPEGGCTRSCEYQLPCGHLCSLKCHPYDPQHEQYKCQKPCKIKCIRGHKCPKKCFQQCGPCQSLVDKHIILCGHTIQVKCHRKDSDLKCTNPCEKNLSCGHICQEICGDTCSLNCKTMVEVSSTICGHQIKVQCFQYEDLTFLAKACVAPCETELSCKHICQGTCGRCCQGRLHVTCNQKCKRILVCGHECQSYCSEVCPPCREPCKNYCIHGKCPKRCGDPCKKCTKPCPCSCSHKKCTLLCAELCNRTPCKEPCTKFLKCKHPCIGVCGEPCPKECKVCDEIINKDIFIDLEN